MNCMDVVMGMARGDFGRVFDAYTRDRSTPMEDKIFDGIDSLTGALAKEEKNGFTLIFFRRKIRSEEKSDHSIEGLMDFIWAKGQEIGELHHDPPSALEAGR